MENELVSIKSTGQPLKRAPRHIFGLGLFFLALLVVGGLWYYNTYVNSLFNFHYQSALNLHKSGDYTGAIASFNSAIANAPDKGAQGQAREMIAFDMFQRNQGTDQNEAMLMYQQLINDSTIPAPVRATALADLATLVTNQNDAFVRQYFSQAPFNFYSTDYSTSTLISQNTVRNTTTNMFYESDLIYPNSLAEYSIANNYTASIADNILVNTTSKTAAALIQKYLDAGDSNRGKVTYSQSNLARQYLYRATSLNVTGGLLDNVSLKDRESAFKLALDQGGDNEKTDPQLRSVVMLIRFRYAVFLLQNFANIRTPEIDQLLQPFADAVQDPASYALTRSMFLAVTAAPSSNNLKMRSTQLAQVSPVFKSFLVSLGWKL